MSSRTDETEEHAALAALADGSLRGRRRADLEEEVARSPELQALLAEQERAVALLRGADVRAPASLRTRVEGAGARPGRATRSGRAARAAPRFGLGHAAAATVALVVAVLALVLVLDGSSGVSAPSLAEAATLGQRAPAAPAPGSSATQPKLLAASVEGVPFPNWRAKFGWRAVGERSATIGGRDTTTVFYAKAGKRLAYTIVAGDPLKVPSGGAPAVREGTPLLAFAGLAGRPAVTWVREGHTCLLTAVGVPRATMLKLAGWKGQGAVPF
jgi:hypothetical protein